MEEDSYDIDTESENESETKLEVKPRPGFLIKKHMKSLDEEIKLYILEYLDDPFNCGLSFQIDIPYPLATGENARPVHRIISGYYSYVMFVYRTEHLNYVNKMNMHPYIVRFGFKKGDIEHILRVEHFKISIFLNDKFCPKFVFKNLFMKNMCTILYKKINPHYEILLSYVTGNGNNNNNNNNNKDKKVLSFSKNEIWIKMPAKVIIKEYDYILKLKYKTTNIPILLIKDSLRIRRNSTGIHLYLTLP